MKESPTPAARETGGSRDWERVNTDPPTPTPPPTGHNWSIGIMGMRGMQRTAPLKHSKSIQLLCNHNMMWWMRGTNGQTLIYSKPMWAAVSCLPFVQCWFMLEHSKMTHMCAHVCVHVHTCAHYCTAASISYIAVARQSRIFAWLKMSLVSPPKQQMQLIAEVQSLTTNMSNYYTQNFVRIILMMHTLKFIRKSPLFLGQMQFIFT